MNTLRHLTLGLVLGTTALASAAGTAGGVFEVRITLSTGSVPLIPPAAVVDPPASEPPIAGTNPPPPGLPGNPPPTGPVAGGPSPGQPVPPPDGPGPVTSPVATIPQQQLLLPTAKATPPGICTGQTLLSGPGATVSVVCSLGQYVTIEPLMRAPFLFQEGGEQRFSFGPGSPLPRSLGGRLNAMLPTGTVTALRILNVSNLVSPLEMLVSF